MSKINQVVDVVLGLQYGDEGKAKIVNDLVNKNNYNVVARFNGGANAGHTIYHNDQKIVFNQIPSGVTNKNTELIIGNGCVLNPISLVNEIKKLDDIGLNVANRLLISDKVTIVTPQNVEDDGKDTTLGTTKRGIGPAYESKFSRKGLKMFQILNENPIENEEFVKALDFLKLNCSILNTSAYLQQIIKSNELILAEGAQAYWLDIDHGTYPFVTSSNTTIGGVITGLGIPAQSLRNIWGVFKSYETRVGNGPFHTELNDRLGEEIRLIGDEFGATTGRSRRTGWLNLDTLKVAINTNGITNLALTKSDILNTFEKIAIFHQNQYLYFDGWKSTNDSDFVYFVEWLEKELQTPISIVSTGKTVHDIIWR